MWIERLELRNYRQYREADVEFAPPGERGISVLQGAMGSGKTNLLNAITWCLYGEEYHLNPKYQGLPIFHMHPESAEGGDRPEPVQVKLFLRETDGRRVVVTRRLYLQLNGRGVLTAIPHPGSAAPDGSHLTCVVQVREDMNSVTNPEVYVTEELVPRSIRDYFLFDGEHLDTYFTEDAGQHIKDAIFRVSQLELLERLIEHLRRRRNEFYKTARTFSPRADEAQRSFQTAFDSAQQLRKEFEDANQQLNDSEKREAEYADQLKRIGGDRIVVLQRRREDLDADIKRINSQLEAAENEKRRLLITSATKFLPITAIQHLSELVAKSSASGQIPPVYRRDFLRKLLADEKCICGSSLEKGSPHRATIQALAENLSVLSEMGLELVEDGARARMILEEATSFPAHLRSLNDRIQQGEAALKLKDQELTEVRVSIGDTTEAQVRDLEEQIQRYRQSKISAIERRATKKAQLDTQEALQSKYQEELDREVRKQGKHSELARMIEFCDRSLRCAERVKDGITSAIRDDVQRMTKESFLKLIWKKETYTDVLIDDSYNLSVIHQSGRAALGTLSAGERQVLALSFVSSLNSVSGFDLPLVVDTPLGRISSEPKLNIAHNLPQILRGKQVILLMTEEENTSGVREALRPAVGKEWRITYRELKHGSEAEVVPYGA